MTVAFYMNCVSAHQLPLARETAKLVGEANFRYVDAGLTGQAYQTADVKESWIVKKPAAEEVLENCDLLLTGLRDFDLIVRRSAAGKKTCYYSERWFKPIPLPKMFGFGEISLPGWLRMLHPGYRCMVHRFVRWANGSPNSRVLAVGPWARGDFIRMGVKEAKIIPWGYFVAPGHPDLRAHERSNAAPSILYIGRLLSLKHVETIVHAVRRLRRASWPVTLTIVGDGPEAARLHKLAARLSLSVDEAVVFRPPVPIAEVRAIMREHSAVIFASNGFDGWGAVVSEALEEGVPTIGTFETGASAALLPPEQLFHCGDVEGLVKCIRHVLSAPAGAVVATIPFDYTAKGAAEKLLAL